MHKKQQLRNKYRDKCHGGNNISLMDLI